MEKLSLAKREEIIKQAKIQNTIEPRVINNKMLEEYIDEYCAENKVDKETMLPKSNLINLSLSFKNIVSIDNLRGLSKLEKLKLDNNIIEKIENLDTLENLKWLDLSFNKIQKIEGLSKLVNLTDLSLYSNLIEKVEGLKGLYNLVFLSIGKNDIKRIWEDIAIPLSDLKLQCLIMSENPFKDEGDYTIKVVSQLPTLKYLDYKMIDKGQRESAQRYSDENKPHKKEQENRNDLTAFKEEEELKSAGIYETATFLENLKAQDQDMQKLSAFDVQKELWKKCEDELKEAISRYQGQMESKNKARLASQEVFQEMVKEAEKIAEAESVMKIDEYRRKQKKFIREHESKKATEVEVKEMLKYIEQLDDALVEIEVRHSSKIDKMIEKKEDDNLSMQKIINGETTDFTGILRKFDSDYHNTLKEATDKEAAKYTTDQQKESIKVQALIDLIENQEERATKLDASKENHDAKIEALNGLIETNVKKSFTDFMLKVNDSVHARNRSIIEEIIKLISNCKAEIMKYMPNDQDSDQD